MTEERLVCGYIAYTLIDFAMNGFISSHQRRINEKSFV